MRPLGILIPAYKPTIWLRRLVEELRRHSFDVIVVDDGSPKKFGGIISQLKALGRVTLLSHKENLGKGAALKTGFRYFSRNQRDSIGLVTADADGQHIVSDILKVAKAMQENPDCLILGVRQFNKKVPLRSRIGNRLARMIFRVLLGIDITDTQTGLRGIPVSFLDDLLRLQSEHYAFETDSLIIALRRRYKIIEVPISTIYVENNRSSHFRPVMDSLRIASVFLRFIGTFFSAMGFPAVASRSSQDCSWPE